MLVYWDRKRQKVVQEYIGANEVQASKRLLEVLEEKVAYWQERIRLVREALKRHEEISQVIRDLDREFRVMQRLEKDIRR